MKVFAQRLRDLRREHGITFKDVALGVGVSINTVSRLEREERISNIENIIALANFLMFQLIIFVDLKTKYIIFAKNFDLFYNLI